MRPDLRRGLLQAGVGAALATLALILALVAQPVPVALSLRAYAVAVGAAVLWLVRSLLPLRPVFGGAPIRPRRKQVQARSTAPGLLEIEHAVDFALSSGFDLHHRLRPLLRTLAAELLAGAGLDLERDQEQVRSRLGEEAWELLRPDRPPAPRRSPGVSPAALERIVADLERLR